MLEGTTLSEGRGTTRPLELFGAPDLDARAIVKEMNALAPRWLDGCRLRECWFEPTFHKHVGQLCHGVQIHTEGPHYEHRPSSPGASRHSLLAIRRLYPDYPLSGAISFTSTSTGDHQSMSSMAVLCCVNGWTMHPPCQAIWMRSRSQMSRRGWMSENNICVTERRSLAHARIKVRTSCPRLSRASVSFTQRRGWPGQARP